MADDTKSRLAEIEETMLATWQREKTFEASLEKNKSTGQYFSFYDGPPFANGLPHFGHSLVTSIKDATLRYKTMRGYYAPRRNGWDCHGLPVEYAIEKDFGVSGKKQIMELGLAKFNAACRDSIFHYKDDWEVLLKRLGRWSEYDKYYATVDSTYTESVWWALAQVHKKGLLYRGYKSTAYCPRCETPLSNFEVNDGYKDDVPDPSLYVKFKLTGEEAFLLGWTTTPWSLPGNAAVAVNPSEQYVYVQTTDDDGASETLVLAKKRLSVLDEQTYTITKEVKGTDLVGKRYEPVFAVEGLEALEGSDTMYQVWPAEFVSIDDGTGVLHVAPAFGEDDLSLGQAAGLPVHPTVDSSGRLLGGLGFDDVKGVFFKDADKLIIEHLTKQGNVFAAETFTHTYPFCWRCDTPLMYYAISSWFIKVSAIRDDLLRTAESINWVPAHIKQGRFGKWLAGARDWAVSRNRYWGAPMPVWVNEDDDTDYLVVESYDQLRELADQPELDTSDVHRPMIDDVVINKDGKTYRRVEEVLDCWFESGVMSIGQQHYPFENKDLFNKTFPADFIIEGLDQTRLWFYVQHVMATILFDQPAYKNVVVNGMIMAADGQKLSKRLKNYPPVEEVFNQEGADSLRLFLLSNTQATQVADYMRFDRRALQDLNRNVLGTLLNSYQFFSMYSQVGGWKPSDELVAQVNGETTTPDNVLDAWLAARVAATTDEVTRWADDYKLAHAITPLFELIDDMSNWYIRRSRKRFRAGETAAYETLWLALVHLSQLLAPWAPFISDYLWRELTAGTKLPSSVHLADWPKAQTYDAAVLNHMNVVRETIKEALALRGEAKIKIRQPLARLIVTAPETMGEAYLDLVRDEINVKEVLVQVASDKRAPELDTNITPELRREGLVRDVIRLVQNARKTAGLQVDDEIALQLTTEDVELQQALGEHAATIQAEALAKSVGSEPVGEPTVVQVGEAELTIGVEKR